MKNSSKLITIFSIGIILFGISDIYNYLTLGKDVMIHYEEISVIKQLVNYGLTQGILKIILGLVPITIIVFRKNLNLIHSWMCNHMKSAKNVKLALLIAYCIPFVFLAVNGDAISRTMLFYGVMIVGFSLLCWGALKTNNVHVLYIGNVLSFVSSYAVAKLSGLEPMGDYFKPFTSYGLIVAISVVAIIIHTIIVLIYRAKEKAA